MTKSVLTILLLLIFIQSFAQDPYQDGLVVNSAGDTLKGLIEYKRWDKSPGKIRFKNSGQTSEYTPLEIRAFSVANENYVSAIVNVDISPYKMGSLDTSPRPTYVPDTVFLQVLIQGEKSLFHLKDQADKNHFYILDEGSYVPLVYKQYTVETRTAAKALRENSGYKGQLALFLKSAPGIEQKLQNTRYNSIALTKLFQFYYEKTNQSFKDLNKRQEGRFEFGALAGVSLTNFNFSGDLDYLKNLKFDPSIDPAFGFFINIKLLRTNQWRISNDFFYSSFDFEDGAFVEAIPDFETTTSFKYQYLKTTHMLQVNLLRRSNLYVAAGLSTGFVLAHDAKTTITYETGTVVNQNFMANTFDLGYVGGVGFHAGRLNVEVRYEKSAMGIVEVHSSDLSRIHGLVKYRLSRR